MSRKAKGAKDRSALEERLGHMFADKTLLERALTHTSATSQNRVGSYQRLEFLGDHVLGLVISDMLFRTFPKGSEGELSKRLADLVRKETCAEVARAMDLAPALRIGSSESSAGVRTRVTVLADTCEALVGAVFLDGGYAASEKVVERFWKERMLKPLRAPNDAKSMLQEWAHARSLPTPVYQEVRRTGPAHSPKFQVSVSLPGRPPTEGIGPTKRVAEQAAAAQMLAREGVVMEAPDA